MPPSSGRRGMIAAAEIRRLRCPVDDPARAPPAFAVEIPSDSENTREQDGGEIEAKFKFGHDADSVGLVSRSAVTSGRTELRFLDCRRRRLGTGDDDRLADVSSFGRRTKPFSDPRETNLCCRDTKRKHADRLSLWRQRQRREDRMQVLTLAIWAQAHSLTPGFRFSSAPLPLGIAPMRFSLDDAPERERPDAARRVLRAHGILDTRSSLPRRCAFEVDLALQTLPGLHDDVRQGCTVRRTGGRARSAGDGGDDMALIVNLERSASHHLGRRRAGARRVAKPLSCRTAEACSFTHRPPGDLLRLRVPRAAVRTACESECGDRYFRRIPSDTSGAENADRITSRSLRRRRGWLEPRVAACSSSITSTT